MSEFDLTANLDSNNSTSRSRGRSSTKAARYRTAVRKKGGQFANEIARAHGNRPRRIFSRATF